ncbi:immunoglobulin domain-containing protein, partial [Akkermansiaceae bacterium]|nr:immunoglobulin domain-containing protein [Akkermansiaceae bacterium]
MKSGWFVFLGLWGLWASAVGQTEILAIEFNQDDQAGFNGWPSALSGASSIADFETDAELTSGTTTVQVSASTGLGIPANRGSSNGSPQGYSYQRLYEDLLIAFTPTGFLTLDFAGLIPNQTYQLTLYAWDPGSSDASNKVWTVTEGTSDPATASVNFQNSLVDNESFSMVFEIKATATGIVQLRNTAGFSQSAINGFILASSGIDPEALPQITSQPQAVWDGGEELVIGVEASGPEPISFQWSLDGQTIAGATSEALTLDSTEWDQNGDYTVRVTNQNGFVESDVAGITIDIPEFPTREELTYEPLGPSSRRSGITISEILYHPAQRSDERELEFIELFNSQPWAEDISGWRLSGEADYV